MNKYSGRQSQWHEFVALAMSFLSGLVSIGGALFIYVNEAELAETSVWPLPGLVLFDWGALGLVGFLATCFCFKLVSATWLQTAWFIAGTFLPLILIGMFSIGPFVLFAYVLFLVSTIILTIRRHPKLVESFGIFLLGTVSNLILLLLLISLGNRS